MVAVSQADEVGRGRVRRQGRAAAQSDEADPGRLPLRHAGRVHERRLHGGLGHDRRGADAGDEDQLLPPRPCPGSSAGIGRVVRWGSQVAFTEGELYDAEGRLLAKATGTAIPTPFTDLQEVAGRLAGPGASAEPGPDRPALSRACRRRARQPFRRLGGRGGRRRLARPLRRPIGGLRQRPPRRVAWRWSTRASHAANLRQFSVRPERYNDTSRRKSDLRPIYDALVDLTGQAKGGCLVYFSSHGAPQGVVRRPAAPAAAACWTSMLDRHLRRRGRRW